MNSNEVSSKFVLNTPVAFFFFNKMDTTLQVFEQIRNIKPKKLYLISDAGRSKEESAMVEKLREKVVEQIDWTCEVKKNFATKNLGCRERMVSGIDWVLGQEENTIILEDDCLPNQSFFRFCQEMLERYKDNDRVMMISGTNLLNSYVIRDDYTFSNFSSIWGWATWKRAWDRYDINIAQWKQDKKTGRLREYYKFFTYIVVAHNWDKVCFKGMNTWDYQWEYCRVACDGLGIVPKYNMIENLGFNHEQATHTVQKTNLEFETRELTFPLMPRNEVERDYQYDLAYQRKFYGMNKLVGFLKRKMHIA